MKSKNRKRANAKVKAIVALSIVFVLTVALALIGVNGMPLDSRGLYKLMPWLPTTDVEAWPSTLPLGLDLRGGVYVEYSAEVPEDTEASFDDLMTGTISVIQARLTDKGYAESTVQRIGGDGLRIEIPDVTDPDAVLDLIGSPAKLEFRTPAGESFMDGSMVELATVQMQEGEYVIAFKLNSEGTEIFAQKTAEYLGQSIAIYLDDVMLINPTVQSVITGGQGVINGMGGLEEAQTVAAKIQSGALPLVLTQQKVDTVSATLGDDALATSVLAAMIGIVLVMLVMIVRYRVNGVIASWALVIYIVTLFFLIAVIPGIQLTLPGIAGIVLGIGMAVDANVIIFERFNDEVRGGRPLKGALRAGFKNAMSAVLDANITTLIAAVVLMFFGTGSIQGFAKTLLLSVITSMFTAVLVTRFLMKHTIALKNWNVNLFTSRVKTVKEEQE
ncbi:MAG: protein translocase subunit SecD [Clostridiales bacterium]|nr:protein translocase subunit SecD [Clostridiales bacterium]